MNYLILVTLSLVLIAGCTTVKKIAENEFEVTVQGGPFDSVDVLKEKATSEARKLCGTKDFEFVKNWMGDDFAFKSEKQYTQNADYNYVTAIAKIKCIQK
jgi:hypothetical protein